MIDKIIITLDDSPGFFNVAIGGVELVHTQDRQEVLRIIMSNLPKLMYVRSHPNDFSREYTYAEYMESETLRKKKLKAK